MEKTREVSLYKSEMRIHWDFFHRASDWLVDFETKIGSATDYETHAALWQHFQTVSYMVEVHYGRLMVIKDKVEELMRQGWWVK